MKGRAEGETMSAVKELPPFENTLIRFGAPLRKLSTQKELRILLFTMRPEYFDATDLFNSCGIVKSVRFIDNEHELEMCTSHFDFALVCTHLLQEHKAQFIIRQKGLAPLIVLWTWDNHIHCSRNLEINSLADIILPAHSRSSGRMKTPHAVLGRHFPLPTSQWSRELTSRLLFRSPDLRVDALSGGYVLWPIGRRNEVLHDLKKRISGNALQLIDENNRDSYFDLSAEERFRQWTKYKVSIVIPLMDDLSTRIFDALIAGQIPIVPDSCPDLDAVISPEMQQILPIVKVRDFSPEAVEAQWRVAIAEFDRGGREGILTRHEYARDYHHISHRIDEVAEYIKNFSKRRISLVVGHKSLGLVAG